MSEELEPRDPQTREERTEEIREERSEDGEPTVPKTGFLRRVEKMPESEWNLWSALAGVVLGLLASASLFFYPKSNGFLPMGSLIALALATVVPRYAERRLERNAPKLRIAMIATLAIALAVFVAVKLITRGAAA
ncbi:MAG: hypothetical protein VB067_04400 [Christensenellaceae bacterium]|nr:hypothetical protein [Christensenellaceae bacterium]MEA5066637.1 hypothetical protein [Eubacteriales bacterium]MEA5068206.1 hypothetical protein [Christensenellaceae bacterium]